MQHLDIKRNFLSAFYLYDNDTMTTSAILPKEVRGSLPLEVSHGIFFRLKTFVSYKFSQGLSDLRWISFLAWTKITKPNMKNEIERLLNILNQNNIWCFKFILIAIKLFFLFYLQKAKHHHDIIFWYGLYDCGHFWMKLLLEK